MKSSGLKVAVVLSTALVSSALIGQVIFLPSPVNCKRPGAGGAFRFCSGSPVTVPFNAVTSTSFKYIFSIPVENTLSYRLYCPAFPDSTLVELAIGTSHQTLLSSSQSLAEKIRQTVNYSSLGTSAYVFSPQINYSATYQPTCKMEVLANLSIPHVDTLRTIVDLVKANYLDLNDLRASIDEAAELPAKWVAIKDSPVTIDGLVDFVENEIAIQKSELDALADADKANLSDADKVRLEELPGIIELYQGMITDLKKLKTDLADVASIAATCQSDVDNAFCLDQVAKVSTYIGNQLAQRKSELVDLNNFLTAESERLKTSALTTSNALKRLITKFE